MNGLTASEHGGTNAPAALTAQEEAPTEHVDAEALERQRQQLQLIQLCFYEHEFGVDVDSDDDDDDNGGRGDEHVRAVGGSDGPAKSLLAFDPLAFINGKVSHGVPLEDLCKDLTFYMDYIKDKINHHVNHDMHTAFVDVSGRLSGMESELLYVERPLEASIKRVSAACEELASLADAVDVAVQHASDVEEERVFDIDFLKGLLLYERIASLVEEELIPLVDAALPASPLPSASPSNGGRLESPKRASSLSPSQSTPQQRAADPDGGDCVDAVCVPASAVEKLQAVATSARQLEVLAATLPPLPQREKERAELASYARESSAAVFQLLRRVFEHLCRMFFERPEAPGVTQALREVTLIYANAQARDPFRAMVREGILAPFLERVFPWKAAAQARQSTEETLRLLRRLEAELGSSITCLFPLFRRCFAGQTLNPASTILWPVLCEVLVKKLVTLYEVGLPDAFHAKYKAAFRLLALAESCCATPEELVALRQSPDVTMWNHKWNTDIYTAIRLTEVMKALEPALAAYQSNCTLNDLRAAAEDKATAVAATAASPMNLEVFRVLHKELLHLFSPDVFLLVCLQKFLREIVTRSQTVCQAVLAYAVNASSSEHAALPFLSLLIADVSQLAQSSCSASGGSGEGQLREQILRAVCGAENGSAAATASFAKPSIDGVLRLLRDSVCQGCLQEAQRLMTSNVEAECLAALQNLKLVRSAYTHTKKPFPTTVSWYVPNVVEPVERFASVCKESGVDAVAVRSMLGSIADSVATQFASLTRETLITAKKTEESWEKLRRRKDTTTAVGAARATAPGDADGEAGGMGPDGPQGAGRPTSETATDRDKMTVQLYLDAKAFEDAVRTVMQNTGEQEVPSYRRSSAVEALMALLRRAEWILGASIPEPAELDEG